MSVTAVVLAAGKGSRLGALTTSTPKPMLPVNGLPLIHHTLDLLAKSGVRRVFINLHHHPDVLTSYCADGAHWGLAITYAYEPRLMGSGGTVKSFAASLSSEPFFVLYGDNYFDVDLNALRKFHCEKKALATIGLVSRDDVTTSGIVGIDNVGRVQRFKEKPARHEMFSHLVNAGVYVLSPEILPLIQNGRCDFGHDVFPRLLAEGWPLYGLAGGSVWPSDTPELYDALVKHLRA